MAGRGLLVSHDGADYRAFGTSEIYPFIVAFSYAASAHSQLALVLVQIFLSTLTVWLLIGLGEAVVGRPAAIIAGLLLALHGPSIVYTGKVESLVVDSLLAVACIGSTLVFDRKRSVAAAGLLGLTFGLAVLSRPTLLVVLSVAFVWLWLRRRLIWRHAVVSLGVMIVLVGSWTARDYLVLGEPIFVSSMSAENLWLGNNPQASGGSLTPEGAVVVTLAPGQFRDKVMAAGEVERYHLYQSAALGYIRADPLGFVKRAVQKAFYFWWFSPQTGIRYERSWTGTYEILYALYLASAILGVTLLVLSGTSQQRAAAMLVVGSLLAVSAAQSVFYVEGRHRWLIEPLLLLFAARGLLSLPGFSKRMAFRRVVRQASV